MEFPLSGGDIAPGIAPGIGIGIGARPDPAGPGTDAVDQLLAALAIGRSCLLPDGGALVFRPEPGAAPLLSALKPARPLTAGQTNACFLAGPVLLKWLRRARPGIHPEAEMTRFLFAHGFDLCPRPLGEILRLRPDGTRYTFAIAQTAILGAEDGWQFVQDRLAAVDEIGITLFATRLGVALAALHGCLAAAPDSATDFAPVTADPALRAAWARAAADQLAAAPAALAAAPALTGADAARLCLHLPQLLARLPGLAASPGQALACRGHGDFHLGQVLLDPVRGPILVDFEGEPDRPLAERRARHSPLRDVAGMLRSFDYAAAIAETATATALCAAGARAFRAAYLAAMARWPVPAASGPCRDALLELFWLEKAAYELGYEAAHRPDWRRIPLAALAAAAQNAPASAPARA